MQKEEFISIVEKVANGTATDEQIAAYLHWYRSFYESADIWTDLREEPETFKKALLSEIHIGIKHAEQPIRKVKLWRRVASVAAAVTAITLGVWLYTISNTPRHPEFSSGSQYTNDVKPGKNTATLTLANGETINLSDAKNGVVVGSDLRYNDGTKVALLSPSGRDGVAREGSRNSKVQTLTASTPRGGTYQVTLPDGTKVWLNADSKITFPSQFSGKQRKILLSGEAYFEVSQNKRIPFIVESQDQQVEVLGTHFNINAYKDETSTKTTLLEGSVRVAFGSPLAPRSSFPRGEMASAREGSVVLQPNQQAILTASNQIKVTQVDPNTAIDWKNGKFICDDTGLPELLTKIARWYNVEFVYQLSQISKDKFTGTLSRTDNISLLLKRIELTGEVKFKIKDNKVYVEK